MIFHYLKPDILISALPTQTIDNFRTCINGTQFEIKQGQVQVEQEVFFQIQNR